MAKMFWNQSKQDFQAEYQPLAAYIACRLHSTHCESRLTSSECDWGGVDGAQTRQLFWMTPKMAKNGKFNFVFVTSG